MPGPVAKLRVKLTIDGQQRFIKGFSYSVPANSIGAMLTLSLANPMNETSDESLITFQVGVEGSSSTSWLTLVENSSIAGRETQVEWEGGDKLSIKSVDKLSDRWRMVPTNPILIYDSNLSSYQTVAEQVKSDVVDELGLPIYAQIIGVGDLTLKEILFRAYVTGCKFSRVVTNIPNYPVQRINFELKGGYHSAAQQLYSLFQPVIFAGNDNVLYILDVNAKLPPEFSLMARKLRDAHYKTFSISRNLDPLLTSVILTYKYDTGNGDGFPVNATDRVVVTDTDAVNQLFGEGFQAFNPGWSKQIISTHYKDFHDDINDLKKTTREVPWKVVTQNYALDDRSRLPLMISRETQVDLYTSNFRLKLGYDKTLESRVQLPYGNPPWDVGNVGLSLQRTIPMVQVMTELNRIQWIPSVLNPDLVYKKYDVTKQSGIILYEGQYEVTDHGYNNIQTNSQVTSAVPIWEASMNRQIQSNGFESITFGPISTIIEYSRDTGTDQVDVQRSETNHLIPQTNYSRTTQAISDRSVNTNRFITRQMLIRNREKEEELRDQGLGPLDPAEVNAGEVPFFIAYPIALRRLRRRTEAPITVEITIPYFDGNLRRGSIREVYDRDGSSDLYLIIGYKIEGQNLGERDKRIFQSIQAVKVITDA